MNVQTYIRWMGRTVVICSVALALAGCGTTRVTDTQRTATEQLLVSNAVDQAISQLDFRCLAGKTVYFDPQYLDGSVDRGYLVSSLRQHLLSCGCVLQEDRTKANYVVEARAGGLGTDRNALLIGVPQLNVPTFVPGQPSSIPEIPLAKKTDQKGIAKIAVFAYNRQTGKPIWQSGVVQASSTAKDTWFLGVGPIQRGTIREGTEFAGEQIQIPLLGGEEDPQLPPVVPVTQAASWNEPPPPKGGITPAIQQASTNPPNQTTAAKPPETGTAFPSASATIAAPKPAPPAPPPPPPAPPPTSNPGGQAENEPAKLLISGFGVKPDN